MNQWRWHSSDGEGASEPECNFTEGIARMMNNRSLYVRLLTKFQTTDNMTPLRVAVESGDGEKIRMEAHTLKGVAANLGLKNLSARAANLDNAIREGHQDQAASLMQLIEESYVKTMLELEAYIAE